MTLYFAGSGQSNASGRGTGGSFTISPLVKVWNNHNERNDLANLGSAWITPVRDQWPFDQNDGNNMFLHAANEIALRAGEEVRLVFVTKGGAPLSQWYSSSDIQPMLARMLAVIDAAGVGMLDGLFWMGHENSDGVTVSTWQGRWNAVKRELREAGHMTTSTPVVMGECSVGHDLSNEQIEACATGKTARAPLKMLATQDGTHYIGDSLVEAGGLIGGLWTALQYTP